ncbi:DNA mismatch repair endonuclease MutL [Pseudoalteromonas ulvae]|uniref:DNA mismatch repair protein MutL n=1 Tax=Pseudoalteromonas ulvae TaxID=107327 RepID=A0A244CPX9_PSEDV|nr:DNA mismatch repair endonuclease MutL [Pseudoalteromonas ulvae]OUL57673.1 DNA mismatch repair protein MutL [Pseudoalteromonas ulvae]
MSIQILPARLANQIAAGEVVERPASVVKELVENSLDAGATRIQIDIERGGHKLIRIRDNGSGIDKGELTLALSRHATSKLKTLDDLENICSLGFRGEALASISSVSRLSLSSKPAHQEDAWQAQAEGRDMAVTVKPVAHPNGTTIEVVDLFFNTPARRKFLRTEKTEFNHIDELLKRIALSRFDVSISLKHNGKMVRQYRPVQNENDTIKRVAQVAGKDFLAHASFLESGDEQLNIHGWILPSGMATEPQYTYVNGRMMRDKLILHAIRQAFEEVCPNQSIPAFVLYLTIDPRQVDVNVHPAKHEVRFHQARLIHDFILQAVKQAAEPTITGLHIALPDDVDIDEYRQSHSDSLALCEPNHQVSQGSYLPRPQSSGASYQPRSISQDAKVQQYTANAFYQGVAEQRAQHFDQPIVVTNEDSPEAPCSSKEVQYLTLEQGRCILKHQGDVYLSHLRNILPDYWQAELEQKGELEGKSLLLPVRVSVSEDNATLLANNLSWLTILGYEFIIQTHYVMIKKLPPCVYSVDVNQVADKLILICQQKLTNIEQWLTWQASWCHPRFFNGQQNASLYQFLINKPQMNALLFEKAVKIDLTDFIEQLERNSIN